MDPIPAEKYWITVCTDYMHGDYETIEEISFNYQDRRIIIQNESIFFCEPGTKRNLIFDGFHERNHPKESKITNITIPLEEVRKIHQMLLDKYEVKTLVEKYFDGQ